MRKCKREFKGLRPTHRSQNRKRKQEFRIVEMDGLPNLVVITLLENYDYFVHTLDTIGNQWEIFVYRFDLPVTSLYNNDICEKFMISMNFGDWIHLITHCSMI